MGVMPSKNNKRDESTDPKEALICSRCGCKLKEIEIHMVYLDRHFTHKVPRCPECGQVFFDQELVEGRVHDLEFALEEK